MDKTDIELRSCLTPCETDILQMLANGLSLKQIGGRLGGKSRSLISMHLMTIRRSLGVHTTAQAVAVAVAVGIVAVPLKDPGS